LNLRLLCVNQKYDVKVVGMEEFGYIIVQARLPLDVASRLAQNNQVVGQVIVDGVAYGFRSQVTNRVTRPAPLLFLSYPDSVERVALRSDERVRVSLPAQIHGKFGDHQVIIVDMTNSGCCITARADMKSPLREAQPGEEVILSAMLGMGQKLMAPVVTRRVEAKNGLVSLGCQFRELTPESSQAVSEYVRSIASYMAAMV
jgi:c-di-GMP-binding flagellar brake protein YcgR